MLTMMMTGHRVLKADTFIQNWPKWLVYLALNFLLFFCYVLFSKLGDFLVIPSGVVSIMWPSAGIALGFVYVFGLRVVPGVFLASLTVTFMRDQSVGQEEFLTAFIVAVGISLHAGVGTKLIRRFANAEFHSGNLRDILSFLFWGGPVACAISALMGTFSLFYMYDFTNTQFWEHVLTWWVGDVFGVVVFAPITAILLSRYRLRHQFLWASKVIIILPAIGAVLAFVWVFGNAKDDFYKQAYDEYYSQVDNMVGNFSQVLSIDITLVNAVSAFIEASDNITSDEYKSFTRPLLENSIGMFGLSWLPKIEDNQRDSFVRLIRSQGYPNFEIRARNALGELQKSEQREIYYPLAYTEPYVTNNTAHGFDVYGQDGISGDVRRGILDEARKLDKPRATSRLSIVQRPGEYGFIIYRPVFKPTGTGEQVHAGFINGIFLYSKLIKQLVKKAATIGSDLILEGISGDGEATLLFDSRTLNNKEGPPESYDLTSVVHTRHYIPVAGQGWRLTFLKNSGLLGSDFVRSIWMLAGGGALFSMLLLIILMMITARSEFVEKLVRQRTSELKLANEELEEFAYRTSHDLRSPIVSSVQLLSLASDAIASNNTKMANHSISHAKRSLAKLDDLISDILILTQIGSENEEEVLLDIEATIDEAISKLDHADGFERLKIRKYISLEDKVLIKPSRFKLILENLISNAAKYQDPNTENPMVEIICYKAGGNLYLEVSDNGLGIAPEYRDQMFEMFKRFHPKVASGSGLGLHLMRKSAGILNGNISYQALEKGSLFRLIVPIIVTRGREI